MYQSKKRVIGDDGATNCSCGISYQSGPAWLAAISLPEPPRRPVSVSLLSELRDPAFLAQIICIIDFISAYCGEQNMQICRNMSMAYSCQGIVRSSHLCYRRETFSTTPTAFLLSYLFDVLRAPRSAGRRDLAVSNHPSQDRFNGRRADVRVKV